MTEPETTTLSDDDIVTTDVPAAQTAAGPMADVSDTGDDSGDPGDDAGDDSGDTGDDSGDTGDVGDTGDDGGTAA